MFYRDFMQKYRPLYAPDGPAAGGADGAAAAAADAGQAAAAAPAPADGGMAAGEGGAAAAPAAPDAAAGAAEAPAAPEPAKSEPSLLEAASGKKPDAAPAADGDKKDSPAPAEAAKTDGDAKPEGDKKPDGEAAADKKDAKPEDGKDPKDDAAKTDLDKKDATAEAQPPAPIKYEAFKLPDGVALDAKELAKFEEVAGKGQVSQDVAQGLIDLYVEERKQDVARAAQHQRDVWNKLNDSWKTDLRKDEKLGGNRIETTLSMAKAVLEEYGGTPEQIQELIAHTSNNGMGNFPGFIRLLTNIGEALNVFEESSVGANLNPPKPQKGPGNRGWYKDMPGAAPQA